MGPNFSAQSSEDLLEPEDGIETKPPTFDEILESFLGRIISKPVGDDEVQRKALVAEVIRLSLADIQPGPDGWRTRHIFSLRNWVYRKLRSVISGLGSPATEGGLFWETLREGRGSNLVFLGDVIELANGYYAPAPSRIVPISDNRCLLVSGLPTSVFMEMEFELHICGLSRTIGEGAEAVRSVLNIPLQLPTTYIGSLSSHPFDEAMVEHLILSEKRRRWAPSRGWRCYQINRGEYDFQWESRHQPVSSPFGQLSAWEAPSDDYRSNRYWLRICHARGDVMVRLPRSLLRQVLLLIDRWAEVPRRVEISSAERGAIIQTRFPPPAAQTRWLHAVGGRWLGSRESWIRWWIPTAALDSAISVFERLPIEVTRSESL